MTPRLLILRLTARRPLSRHRIRAAAVPLVLALLASATCNTGSPADRTIVPTGMPFAEMFRLVEVLTPEQPPESPIAVISGTSWDGDRIAIADVLEANAKLFDSDGSLVAILGRRGEGPGEFMAARYPDLLNGRLLVADGQGGRVSVWTDAGELEREIEVGIGHVSGFAALPNGRLVFTGLGFGRVESALGVYSPDGTQLMQGLYTNDVLPADVSPDLPWGNMRQTLFAAANDTAWAVSTISDSIWVVPLNRDVVEPESYRLAIPGYVAPAAPENPIRSPQDLMNWGKSFHGAARPVASSGLLAIPFVRGVLNYGDPAILVVRDNSGAWYALSDPPPVIAASSNRLLVIHNPLGDPVELAVYEQQSVNQTRH